MMKNYVLCKCIELFLNRFIDSVRSAPWYADDKLTSFQKTEVRKKYTYRDIEHSERQISSKTRLNKQT